MILTIDNPSLENAEKTILTDPVAPGAVHLYVKSSQGYSNSQLTVIGEPGNEKTEIKQINAAITEDTGLDITATDYSHNEGDPVYYARYNQIKIYKSATLAGTYVLLDTVSIDVDNSNTVYDDTTGLSTDYYKISYYNSQSTLESSLSDPIPGGGIETDTVRYVTDQILEEAKDKSEMIASRDEVRGWMVDCNNDVKGRKRKWGFWYKRAASTRTISKGYLELEGDFGITDLDLIDHLDHNLNDGSTTDITYRLRYVSPISFDTQTPDNDASTSDSTQIWTYDEARDYIRINPVPDTTQAAAYYLYYYKNPNALDSDGDTLEIPDLAIYKNYCLSRFFAKKGDNNKMSFYMAEYEKKVGMLQKRNRKYVGPIGFRYQSDDLRNDYKY